MNKNTETLINKSLRVTLDSYKLGVENSLHYTKIDSFDNEFGVQGFFGTFFIEGTEYGFIAFAGSNQIRDWIYNIQVHKKKLDKAKNSIKSMFSDRLFKFSNVKVHQGFMEMHMSILEKTHDIFDRLTQDNLQVIITGHSLGGALAVHTANDLSIAFPNRSHLITCITFGCPRIGNRRFRNYTNGILDEHIRVIYGNDIVTKLPPLLLGYRHCGQKKRYNHKWWKFLPRITDHIKYGKILE